MRRQRATFVAAEAIEASSPQPVMSMFCRATKCCLFPTLPSPLLCSPSPIQCNSPSLPLPNHLPTPSRKRLALRDMLLRPFSRVRRIGFFAVERIDALHEMNGQECRCFGLGQFRGRADFVAEGAVVLLSNEQETWVRRENGGKEREGGRGRGLSLRRVIC